MSASEQLFLPFDEIDIPQNASENNVIVYLNPVIELGRKVLYPIKNTEAEIYHGKRRFDKIQHASILFEQGMYEAVISMLQEIKSDYEIVQGLTYLPDIDIVIHQCRQLATAKVAKSAVQNIVEKVAS